MLSDSQLADTIAGNASSAGVILGQSRIAPSQVDIGSISAVLFQGEAEIARGDASAVLGDPTKAVARSACKEAGRVILPGSYPRAIDANPGVVFRADFS